MAEVRAIAADASGRHFAAAAFEGTVALWSIEERRRIARLDTCFEWGGERMALVGGETLRLVVGAYHRHGVEAYGLSGDRLWARSDLKRVQSVRGLTLPSLGSVVGVGVERGSFVILSTESGRTLDRLRGVRAVYTDEGGQCSVRVQTGRVTVASPLGMRVVGLDSFAVLDAAVSTDAVLLSEAGGSVRCLDLEGGERWRWTAGRGVHALSVAWHPTRVCWLALVWPFETGGDKACVELSTTGAEVARTMIGSPVAHAFTRHGQLLLTSDAIYDTERCDTQWRLEGILDHG